MMAKDCHKWTRLPQMDNFHSNFFNDLILNSFHSYKYMLRDRSIEFGERKILTL